jgi:thiopeptide-type bacteriocin biosynthesis protein
MSVSLLKVAREGRPGGVFFVQVGVPSPALRVRAWREGQSPQEIASWLRASLLGAEGARELAYEPELERYGGEVGLRLAERVFQASTIGVLEAALAGQLGSPATRLRTSLLAGLQLGAAFFKEQGQCARFFARWVARWVASEGEELGTDEAMRRWGLVRRRIERQGGAVVPLLQDLWTQSQRGESEGWAAELQRELRDLARLHGTAVDAGALRRDHLEEVMVPSYLHMSNHRHGVLRVDELYLAGLLALGLGGGGWIAEEIRAAHLGVREAVRS